MIDLDRETWLYILIIVAILAFFLWNSNRSKKIKKERMGRKITYIGRAYQLLDRPRKYNKQND